MTNARLRPTFLIPTDLEAKEAIGRIRTAVDLNSNGLTGQFMSNHAMVSIVESNRHFWSPWLHLEIRELDTGCAVSGRFSPHASIWTGIVFAYLSLVVLIFFSIVMGTSQVLANLVPWGFWLLPVWIAVGGGIWVASQMGQRLAWDEMDLLKKIVGQAVNGQ